jgi:hypothetical protein
MSFFYVFLLKRCGILFSKLKKKFTLRTGFEPVRAEPNGFQVHLLNHSDTAAPYKWELRSVES